MRAPIRVGTSGWEYPHWIRSFYPRDLARDRRLEFYSDRFDTVEVNNSFYRLPDAEVFARWAGRVPERFAFAVKASRYLTHVRRLREPEEPLQRLWSRTGRLGNHLGPMLYQLPPRWRPNHDRLAAFLACVPQGRSQAIEIRDRRWYGAQLTGILTDAGVALCIHDMPESSPDPERIGPFVYARFHGAGERYGGAYSTQRLTAWAGHMAAWSQQGWPVWAYFNNDIGGHAIRDAERLRLLLQRRGLT
jgi:uncharacterized protein YecE (DUF72 family)